MNTSEMIRTLQSRIDLRGNIITELEQKRAGLKAYKKIVSTLLERFWLQDVLKPATEIQKAEYMKSMASIREAINCLSTDQKVDKRTLKIIRSLHKLKTATKSSDYAFSLHCVLASV